MIGRQARHRSAQEGSGRTPALAPSSRSDCLSKLPVVSKPGPAGPIACPACAPVCSTNRSLRKCLNGLAARLPACLPGGLQAHLPECLPTLDVAGRQGAPLVRLTACLAAGLPVLVPRADGPGGGPCSPACPKMARCVARRLAEVMALLVR